jgi:hypothetical protein
MVIRKVLYGTVREVLQQNAELVSFDLAGVEYGAGDFQREIRWGTLLNLKNLRSVARFPRKASQH